MRDCIQITHHESKQAQLHQAIFEYGSRNNFNSTTFSFCSGYLNKGPPYTAKNIQAQTLKPWRR